MHLSSKPVSHRLSSLCGPGANRLPARDAFDLRETVDRDGVQRLTAYGELDLSTAPVLQSRLRVLAESGQRVRLDLSELQFIDSTGISTLVEALLEPTGNGWNLEVDARVSNEVARVIELTGVAAHLWPTERQQPSNGTAPVRRQGTAPPLP